MAKHNVGDRRIVSVSIPEDVAQELDRWTGGGKNQTGAASGLFKPYGTGWTSKVPTINEVGKQTAFATIRC